MFSGVFTGLTNNKTNNSSTDFHSRLEMSTDVEIVARWLLSCRSGKNLVAAFLHFNLPSTVCPSQPDLQIELLDHRQHRLRVPLRIVNWMVRVLGDPEVLEILGRVANQSLVERAEVG